MPNFRRTESVTTKKSLVFELSEFETDPPGSTTFVTLDVLGETGGFIGASACVLAEHDVVDFLNRLEKLANGVGGEAVLRGGSGSSEDVRIHAFPADSLGHIRIHAILAEVPNHEYRCRLELFFETEPQPALRFVASLRSAIKTRKTGEFAMFVKGGAAV